MSIKVNKFDIGNLFNVDKLIQKNNRVSFSNTNSNTTLSFVYYYLEINFFFLLLLSLE